MDREKLKQAIEFAKQNPDSDYANELRKRIESGQIVIEKQEPNYLQRVGEQFSNIGERTTKAIEKSSQGYSEKAQKGDVVGATGELLRSGLRAVGAVAEGAFAPITEAPVVKDALNFVGEKIGNTEIGQRLAKKIQENPETAQDIMDIVNTLALGGGKVIEAPAKSITGETLQKTGSAIEKSGLKALETKKTSFVRDLVRPEQTKAVKEAQVGRTVEKGTGSFKRSEIIPTETELRMERAISSIPEVKSTNTFQQNYNIIKEANTKEAKLLEKQISDNDFIIPKKEIKSRLVQAKNSLAESPLVTGDAEKMAEKLLAKANQLVDQNTGTGSGILKARKEYDSWVMSQKPKAFDATAENAFTLANREVRKTFNTILDEKAIDVKVKESLLKQSSLYNAMDNIAPKAAVEADTAIGRAYNNLSKIVGTKNKSVQIIAALAGVGGLGAAATFATPALVTGGLAFLGYKGAKLLMKPEIRIQLGKLLKESGKLLNPEDKAILENAIKKYSETPNKQGGFVSLKGKGTIPENSELPKTAKVWIKSKFSDQGAYADVPITRKVENMTLYQGSKMGEKRQFWTPDKKYAEQFGEVKSKTGDFYKIDNGNRMTDVYIEAPKLKSSPENSLISEAKKYKSAEEFVKDATSSEIRYQLRGGLDKIANEIPVKSLTGSQKIGEKTVQYWKDKINETIITPGLKGTEGFSPIITDGNKIVDGFHKLQAYKELGFKNVPTIDKSQLTDIWKKANNK